jgi:hypothetical protein
MSGLMSCNNSRIFIWKICWSRGYGYHTSHPQAYSRQY